MDDCALCDEILTVQTGPLANQVCLHLWNYEAYFSTTDYTRLSSDPCDNPNHVPYLRQHVLCDRRSGFLIPRTLALDLPSSVDYGFHFEDAGSGGQNTCPFWDGAVQSVFRSNLPSSLDNSMNKCSQWTTCFYPHIRRLWRENDMICTLSNVDYTSTTQANTEETSTLSFAQGINVLRSGTSFADDVDNRLRRLLERCDRPSAFQLVTEAETGFVGLNFSLLDWWLEEFPKRPVITVALYDSNRLRTAEPKIQRISRAHQLILASRMESTEEGLTHATWIPLDLTSISNPNLSGCSGPSLLAAGISCLTTALRLDPTKGGLSPDSWLALSQMGTSRRMLTARVGFAKTDTLPNVLSWKTLSPFCSGQSEISSTSRWREVSLRGIPSNPTGTRILQFATAPTGTQRPEDLFEQTEHSDPVIMYPRLDPGARVSVMPQLSEYPIRLHLSSSSSVPCTQPAEVRIASLLDAPGDQSVEFKQLHNLVDSFKPYRSRCPLDGIESDQWEEFVEAGRRYLLDPFQGK